MSVIPREIEEKAREKVKKLKKRFSIAELEIWIEAYSEGWKDGDMNGYSEAQKESRTEELGIE